ncbi:MAG: DNRLRE domain-containing protein, partial [Acetomicrobium sp.]
MNFVQGRFDILKPPVTILRFHAVKDAFTYASIPTLNYGDTHDLLTGLNYESFIGFDLSGLPEQEFIYSKLVLTPPRAVKPSEIPLEIHKLSSDQPWTETGITHANRPRDTSLLYTLVPSGTKVEVDLQGSFEEVYVLKSEELYRFFSKESGKGPYIEVAFIDPDAFREIEGRYLQVAYTAQRPANSDFKLEWDGTLPYGESAFRLSYELSNIFLLTYTA